jgi:hypothetical protein
MCKVKTELSLIHFGSRCKLADSVFVLVYTIIKREVKLHLPPLYLMPFTGQPHHGYHISDRGSEPVLFVK